MPVEIKRGGGGLSVTFGSFYCDTWNEVFNLIDEINMVWRKHLVDNKIDISKIKLFDISKIKLWDIPEDKKDEDEDEDMYLEDD